MSGISEGFAEGEPCWADATVLDVDAGKRFYGELFGWDFGEGSPEYGGYAEATSGGKVVAALAPQMAGQEAPPAWTLYFASPDVAATARKVREMGGRVLLDPMDVGDLGRMLLAAEPGGVIFGVWQGGQHPGFGRRGEPGSFVWAEVVTPDPDGADAFFPAVFPFEAERVVGPPEFDYQVWNVAGRAVAGRMALPSGAPAGTPPHAEVYFGVEDCDAAVETVRRLGGRVIGGPNDSPFGRVASVADDQGVEFTVIDQSAARGEPPETGLPRERKSNRGAISGT
ncbi:VOC family protein [Streptomyces sp. SBT349]|uniref:VOC family protein n=1 Tax=Streptomyces sp. SBT349 TaxID=1580539 RepID=UPI001F3158AE|nr:VOC family protein [Streptomyces sp. SBT349]